MVIISIDGSLGLTPQRRLVSYIAAVVWLNILFTKRLVGTGQPCLTEYCIKITDEIIR